MKHKYKYMTCDIIFNLEKSTQKRVKQAWAELGPEMENVASMQALLANNF